MPDPTRPHEDDLITVHISEAASQVLRRAAKRIRADEHAIVDFAANLILGSLLYYNVKPTAERGPIRPGGKDYPHTTVISKELAYRIRPYLCTLGVQLSDAINDCITHISMRPNIQSFHHANVRTMGHFRQPLFRIEQGQPPTRVKESPAPQETKEEALVATGAT